MCRRSPPAWSQWRSSPCFSWCYGCAPAASVEDELRILITGAAGMIGRKLTERLVKEGRLAGRPITSMDLSDVVAALVPPAPGIKVRPRPGDLSMPGAADALIEKRPDIVFH